MPKMPKQTIKIKQQNQRTAKKQQSSKSSKQYYKKNITKKVNNNNSNNNNNNNKKISPTKEFSQQQNENIQPNQQQQQQQKKYQKVVYQNQPLMKLQQQKQQQQEEEEKSPKLKQIKLSQQPMEKEQSLNTINTSSSKSSQQPQPQIIKKVVFNEIVNVGYTHHPSDYDRSSISISQLTTEDILEIINMRRQFQEETKQLQQQREYGLNLNLNLKPTENEIQQQYYMNERVKQQQQQQQYLLNERVKQQQIEYQIYQRQLLEKKYLEHLQYQAIQNQWLQQYTTTSTMTESIASPTSDVWQNFDNWAQNKSTCQSQSQQSESIYANTSDYYYYKVAEMSNDAFNLSSYPLDNNNNTVNNNLYNNIHSVIDNMSLISAATAVAAKTTGIAKSSFVDSIHLANTFNDTLPFYSMTPPPMEVM